MDLIHADEQRVEIGFVDEYAKYDASIRADGDLAANSFQLTMNNDVWARSKILVGHYLYIPGTEWGGRVDEVRHSTKQRQISVSGATWRGMLLRKVVEPPEGQTHFVVPAMEANLALAYIVGSVFDDLVAIDPGDSGVPVSGQYRYPTMLEMLEGLLERAGMGLYCRYQSGLRKVMIGARQIIDHSHSIDLSQDYGVDMTSSRGRLENYNHIIALGQGEMLDRLILHVYRHDDGAISETRPDGLGGANEVVYKYDYPNAESRDELLRGAVKKAKEFAGDAAVGIDTGVLTMSLELRDIVGARDRLTGIAAKASVVEKILTMDAHGEVIQTKTETIGLWDNTSV